MLSCAGGQVPKNAEVWPAGTGGIELHAKADNMLNMFEDKPHVLHLCIYQLNAAKVFKDMAKDEEGIVKLLSCKPFNDSVVRTQRVIIQPAETRVITIDREESTQFVAVAAGYFESKPGDMTRLYEIPLLVYEEGGLFSSQKYRWPKPLSVELFFGSKGISEMESAE